MILDIRYNNGKAPEQLQGVRMTSLYTDADKEDGKPELVVHFYIGQHNIPLDTVYCTTTTND